VQTHSLSKLHPSFRICEGPAFGTVIVESGARGGGSANQDVCGRLHSCRSMSAEAVKEVDRGRCACGAAAFQRRVTYVTRGAWSHALLFGWARAAQPSSVAMAQFHDRGCILDVRIRRRGRSRCADFRLAARPRDRTGPGRDSPGQRKAEPSLGHDRCAAHASASRRREAGG
jgi:hypothetical protein